ncbi:ketol-acid reductoisomerase [Helicobacter cholecystus]|uniref:Ketol-acid reductoisomerase (NADP(+)) n=1 Tax=Helicobacter cholecystus TaxID=45498 RepID=A0A3D8IZG5_9HELI|nr:ketol-acid reductoisomerase [Helicobacter cholecystus]RDU70004.1 ketol-acid reductoisomerase [Helicobacter cholecystus]VEJ24826.1 ketol-acid reductoisomerase [Helicobacter cholecystus]
MALKLYTQDDIHTHLLSNKKIAILGFGAQGKAQAQNLKDSGLDVKIALREDSPSIKSAQELGFEVLNIEQSVKECDILAFLLPDEWHKEVFCSISPYLQEGQVLLFSHGFSIVVGEIIPPSFVDVILVAPKGAGRAVRSEYLEGRGVVSLIGVHQDFSHHAQDIALEYACALGSGKSAIFQSSFKDEYECDLFSEQSVICGGLEALIRAGFETLTQAGYPQEVAYFECLHEAKIVMDLIYAKGIAYMREHISNTAEYGDILAGERIINAQVKEEMKAILRDIQEGKFAKKFIQEREEGFSTLQKERKILQDSQIEKTGKQMRGLMPWVTQF